MILRKFLPFLFVALIFSACGSEDEAYEPEARRVYVALGDSVSEGFGMRTQGDRHTSLFFEMLQTGGHANEYVNLAVSGHTTGDLLELLHGLSPAELETMQHAKIITLNIGGNNLLWPASKHFPTTPRDAQRIAEETMAFAEDARELVREVMEFADESRDTIGDMLDFANEIMELSENFGIRDVFRLPEIVDSAAPVIAGATEIFAEVTGIEAAASEMLGRATELEAFELFSLFSGNLPESLEAELQEGVRLFSYEFAEILNIIERVAPNAVLIVNTVYNPIPAEFMGVPVGISHEAQRFVHAINDAIREESQLRGFVVSDVYAEISQQLDMMNVSFDLIHPSQKGHETIAELNFSDFLR